jgi:hypothetical protein
MPSRCAAPVEAGHSQLLSTVVRCTRVHLLPDSVSGAGGIILMVPTAVTARAEPVVTVRLTRTAIT